MTEAFDKVGKPAAPLEVSMDKEPSSPLPASSMAGKKQPPPPLAVFVDVELSPPSPASTVSTASTASTAGVAFCKKEKPPAVTLVCLWALFNAVIFAGGAIVELIMNRHPCTTSTWFSRCVELTAAAAVEASALVRGELWCSAPQAVAAALALVLAGRGRHRSFWAWALALVALVATAASHYMEGRVGRIFLAAAPGDPFIAFDVAMGFVLALIDLIGFCLLIIGDRGEE